MKKARKLLVTLLVLTFVMSMFNVGFAAEEEKLPTEVVRAQALGILKGDDQGNLNLDQPITRAEALALIVRISGLEKSAELMAGQTQFADVNAAPNLQWATGYINLGVGQGIVNGYPDGTFKGTNQVTYAEMAKMLLYAMNYGVTVEGGVWPAAVMGKADDLGIFDKVNALPNIPALRGDVVKMIDNSLTVNHLEQTGYGDLKQYLEGDKNFLSKMDVEELEDYFVTKIGKVANSKLDEDEIIVTKYDKNDRVENEETLTLKADVNPEAIFGLKVDLWVNDDDEVFFVKVKTAEKDILKDTVKSNTASKIELLVADDEYKVSSDAKIYVNFAPADLEDEDEEVIDLGSIYGKVVLDRGDIVFANFFSFDNNGVVTSVSGEKVEYFKDSDSIRRLNLDDYDEYYIYDKDFKVATLKDIVEDSAIFWFENDDDEIFIVVVNDKVEGELTRAKNDEITVDGNKYKTSAVSNATVSSNDNDDVIRYDASATATEDLLGEDVVAILDVNGRVRHITGDAEAVSGTNYGIITEAYRSGRYYYADIFTKEGKKVEYQFANNGDGQDVVDYLEDSPYAVAKFKLNSDGQIDKSFEIDDNVIADIDEAVDVAEFDDEDDFIEFPGDVTYFVTDSTILMNAEPAAEEDPDDPELVKWDSIKSKSASGVKAIYVFDKKDLKFVAFTQGIESAASDVEYAVVTSAPWRESKGWKVELNVFGEGKQEYFLDDDDDKGDFEKGDLVAFKLTTSNKIKSDFKINTELGDNRVVAASVYDVDGNYIALNGEEDWVRISKDAVVYSTGKTYPNKGLDKLLSYSDIDVEDYIVVVTNNKGDIVLALIYKK
jgi:hypothetical protein